MAEIASRVLPDAEGVMCGGQRRLDVAQGRVDGQEERVLGAHRTAAGDVGLLQDAHAAHNGEAAQAVGDQGGRRRQRLLGEGVGRLLGEGPLSVSLLAVKLQ